MAGLQILKIGTLGKIFFKWTELPIILLHSRNRTIHVALHRIMQMPGMAKSSKIKVKILFSNHIQSLLTCVCGLKLNILSRTAEETDRRSANWQVAIQIIC